MWTVQPTLQRSLTLIVLALLILLTTPFTLMHTPTDIFPKVDVPVASITQNYNGLPAKKMADRIMSITEHSLTTTVSDIEHVESQSLGGVSIIKAFFRPSANIQTTLTQIMANIQAQVRQSPPGITSPLVIECSASSIPILQLSLSNNTLSEQELNGATLNFLRPHLITVPGIAVPFPYGGRSRQITVGLDTQKLLAQGLTSMDIVNAVGAQNLTLPAGTQKINATEYGVTLSGIPGSIVALNAIPVKTSNDATLYLSGTASARDDFSPQTNVVRQDGQRGVLLSILKGGGASTLEIVSNIYKLLPTATAALPQDLKITPLFDQSLFVKAAIEGVIHEALIAACLTATVILLFLGSWRSTAIIAVSIPLPILSSTIVLRLIGETINLMTLGDLALAIGILVDDATITIENIERHLHGGKEPITATLDGATRIAVPALVSALCICIVFVPMFLLTGVTRYLFMSMAEAMIFVVLTSYVLSYALVPTLVMMLMTGHTQDARHTGIKPSMFGRIYRAFSTQFEHVHGNYTAILGELLEYRRVLVLSFLGFCTTSCALCLVLGRDFFPDVDAGQIHLHMCAPSGLQIGETTRLVDEVGTAIREITPKQELSTILDSLDVPNSGINLSYNSAGTIGTLDGEILTALRESERKPSAEHIRRLRKALSERSPDVEFALQPTNTVNRILGFGLPSAIDIQFSGADVTTNRQLADILANRIKQIPGAMDTYVHQRSDQPTLALSVSRTRVRQVGLEGRDAAQNLLVSLGSSFQISPTFWLNPINGVAYQVAVTSPQYRVDSLDTLLHAPVASLRGDAAQAGGPQLLGNLVQVSPAVQPQVVSHYNITPVADIYAAVQGRDLGAVAREVQKAIDGIRPKLPRDAQIAMRGQVNTMGSSFLGLSVGLVMTIVLVYLLIVVNFQSRISPPIVVTAPPTALAGIAWMLLLAGTMLSVPLLTGAIITVGVTTVSSVLLVPSARKRLAEGTVPVQAALRADATRLHPALMTALAMIIGMVPMALGLNEGAEQNVPLGCAVISGLLFVTVSALFFAPVVFASVHSRLRRHAARHNRGLRESEGRVWTDIQCPFRDAF